jgi:excisionase family DNA binding protein
MVAHDLIPVPVGERILRELHEIRELLAGARKPVLTVEEVAALTGRTPYTVRRWIALGRIRATRVNGSGPKGRLLMAREQLDSLLGEGKGGHLAPLDTTAPLVEAEPRAPAGSPSAERARGRGVGSPAGGRTFPQGATSKP